MANLEKRSNHYRIVFRFSGRKYSRSLKTQDGYAARSALARLEDNLRRVELGLLALPDDVDIASFLLSDGKIESKPKVCETRTLKQLCERFFSSLPTGSIEDSTIRGMKTHVGHLQSIIGEGFPVHTLQIDDLQRYVELRSQMKGTRGRKLSSATCKKEIITFTTIWSWAIHAGIISRPFPKRGLKYPKTKEKPRFQTYSEIEARTARGDLSEADQAELWDAAFLTLTNINELLEHVKQHATQPFVYPMFVFAAHTGARRSEILRSLVDDLDFTTRMITIREKKRVRGKDSTRRVPMSEELMNTLKDWMKVHPGGSHTFCTSMIVPRSKTKRTGPTPITQDESHDFFKRTLADGKWCKLRGWHVFRHSFCSNLAAARVEQRIISEWVGHQTEEMIRRYRHLIPSQEHSIFATVFKRD